MAKVSDRQLREAVLRLSDPNGQPGLVHQIPADAELIDIINCYQYERYPHEKAYCAKCRAYRHRDGFTARLSNNSLVLLGSACGASVFGVSWSEAHKNFDILVSRQSTLAMLDRMGPRCHAMLAALIDWTFYCRQLAHFRREFRTAMPELYNALRSAKDAELPVWARVRDYAAEQRQPEGRNFEVYKMVIASRLKLAGAEFFTGPDPEKARDQADKLIREIWSLHQKGTDGVSHISIDKKLRALSDAIADMRTVKNMRGAYHRFMDQREIVLNWASKSAEVAGEYRTMTGGIYRIDTQKGFAPEEHLAEPSGELLDLHRTANA